jgi:hypothetical protein
VRSVRPLPPAAVAIKTSVAAGTNDIGDVDSQEKGDVDDGDEGALLLVRIKQVVPILHAQMPEACLLLVSIASPDILELWELMRTALSSAVKS